MTIGSHYWIRSARYEELVQLAAIEQRAGMIFSATAHADVCFGPNVPLEVVVERWRAGFVLVAVVAVDVVVGFAMGGDLGGEAFLQEIDVEPAFGRRGIGKTLLEAVRGWATQRGYQTLVLSTFVDVPWNAPFYSRCGFKIIPEVDLTPAMRKVREQELQAGLVLDRRVFMRLNDLR